MLLKGIPSHGVADVKCIHAPHTAALGNKSPVAVVNERRIRKTSTMGWNYINLAPHDIVMNDGTVYKPSGTIARVSVEFDDVADGVAKQKFGAVINLPEPQADVRYIVSGLVLGACADRKDVVAPATGHPLCVRDDKKQIVSVPCFTQL